jgi:hypothetical protein
LNPLSSVRAGPSAGHYPAKLFQLTLNFGSTGVVTSGLGYVQSRKQDRSSVFRQGRNWLRIGHFLISPQPTTIAGIVEDHPVANFADFRRRPTRQKTGAE